MSVKVMNVKWLNFFFDEVVSAYWFGYLENDTYGKLLDIVNSHSLHLRLQKQFKRYFHNLKYRKTSG